MEPLDPVAELMRLADAFAHAWQLDYSLESCGDARTALSDAITLALADARRLALEEAAKEIDSHEGYENSIMGDHIRDLIDGKTT